MCGRYHLAGLDSWQVEEYLRMVSEFNHKIEVPPNHDALKISGDIFPSNKAPIIANNTHLEPNLFTMQWGYTLKSSKKLVINARSETASEKYMFKTGMSQRRCLVPALLYYEWEKSADKKIKHAIFMKDEENLFMAGIYRIEDNIPKFTILTRPAAPNISFIHDRMPVVLPLSAQKDWLNIKINANTIIGRACDDMIHKIDE